MTVIEIGRLVGSVADVGYCRHAEDPYAAVAGNDYFGNGAHAKEVRADAAVEAYLGRSLVGGTRAPEIHSLMDAESKLICTLARKILKLKVVRAGHIGEAGAEFLHVGADEGVGHHIYMVGDHDHVSNLECRIGGTCCIEHEEEFDSELPEYTHAYGYCFHRIAFVIVEAALHHKHLDTVQRPGKEIPLMAYSR